MKNIDTQRSVPIAIASQEEFGDYRFGSLSAGGTNNPFTTLDVNTTVGIVKINGYFFGRFLTRAYHKIAKEEEYRHSFMVGTGTHNHMEDHFLEAVELLLKNEELRPVLKMLLAQSRDRDALVITLKGTKAPCSKCAKNLIGFIDAMHEKLEVDGKKIKVFLRCKAIGLYAAEGQDEQVKVLKNLLNKGIPLLPWAVVQKGGKALTRRGLRHEFSNWKDDWQTEIKDYFTQMQGMKELGFFNFDKKDQSNKNYVALRVAIYRSLTLFREYSLKIKSL